tara:strand:- start:2689 stop:3846 length:1158 start_codon:yes stop_codon:yes gene_type:complete
MPKVNKVGIRKRAKGSYQLRWSVDGKLYEKSVEAKTETQASEIRAKLIAETKSGNYISKSELTLNEFYQIFRKDYLIPNSADMTINDYDVKFKRYVVTRLGKMKLQKVKAVDVYDFYSNVRNTTKAKEGTLKIVHAYLRKILNFAVDLEFIAVNPMAKVKTPKPVVKKFVTWTPDQVDEFLNHSKAKNIWSYYPMALTVMTGLRRSEVVGLKWEDIDFKKGVIHLTRTVHEISGKKYPVIQYGKTRKSMSTIPVPQIALDLLKDIQGFYLTVSSQVDKDKFSNDEGWVFLNSYGKLINSGWVTNSFRRNLEQINLPKPMNLKGFRHLFATFLLQKNAHPKLVQELLRHTTFKLTMDTYSHVIESMGREAVSLIDEVFSGAKQTNG